MSLLDTSTLLQTVNTRQTLPFPEVKDVVENVLEKEWMYYELDHVVMFSHDNMIAVLKEVYHNHETYIAPCFVWSKDDYHNLSCPDVIHVPAVQGYCFSATIDDNWHVFSIQDKNGAFWQGT